MNEREWDKRLHIRTVGREDEDNPHYSPYEPTPYTVLRRLADSGHIRRRDHLLDYGCGKGRVAFFMVSVIGCRVTGIDHSRKLINMAVENRRASGLGDRIIDDGGSGDGGYDDSALVLLVLCHGDPPCSYVRLRSLDSNIMNYKKALFN